MDQGQTNRLFEDFVSIRQKWWPGINDFIVDLVEKSLPNQTHLRRMIHYQLQSGGKRLRAILPLIISKSLGSNPSSIVPFAAACEVLHNASLVHDDIQDGDSQRRGSLSAWKKFGVPQAINLGDAMITLTSLLIEHLDLREEPKSKVRMRVLNDMLTVIGGQVMEFDLSVEEGVSLDQYISMVEKKTSSLFSLPLVGTAIACDSDDGVVEALSESARQIGVLFQIQDDVLDIFGAGDSTELCSDLREGKPNVLIVHFLQTVEATKKDWLLEIMDKPARATTQSETEEIQQAFRESGTLAFALQELDLRREQALELSQIDKSEYHKLVSVLEEACRYFLHPTSKLVR